MPLFKWMFSSSALALWPIIFFKLGFTLAHSLLAYFFALWHPLLAWGYHRLFCLLRRKPQRNGIKPNQTSMRCQPLYLAADRLCHIIIFCYNVYLVKAASSSPRSGFFYLSSRQLIVLCVLVAAL